MEISTSNQISFRSICPFVMDTRLILLLAQVLAEILRVVHVLHDLVLDGILGSLHAIVVIKCLLYLRWRSSEGKESQDVVANVVVKPSSSQPLFLV